MLRTAPENARKDYASYNTTTANRPEAPVEEDLWDIIGRGPRRNARSNSPIHDDLFSIAKERAIVALAYADPTEHLLQEMEAQIQTMERKLASLPEVQRTHPLVVDDCRQHLSREATITELSATLMNRLHQITRLRASSDETRAN